jgi:hypothetical protein
MFPLIALPLSLVFIVGAVVLARSLRGGRRSFRRADDLTPVSDQWLADRRRGD